jgi:hypothetical protein
VLPDQECGVDHVIWKRVYVVPLKTVVPSDPLTVGLTQGFNEISPAVLRERWECPPASLHLYPQEAHSR